MAERKISIDTFKKEADDILSQAFTSSFWKIAAVCSIIGLYPTIAIMLEEIFQINKPWLWAIPVWTSFFIVFIGMICIFAYGKIRDKIKKLDIDEFKTQEYLFKLGAQYHGRAYKFIKIIMNITSSGAGDKKQNFNLCAVGEHVYSIDYFSKTPSVGQESQNAECHIMQAETRDKGTVKIIPNEIMLSATECRWEIQFLPRLSRGESIEYYFEHKSPDTAYAMTKKELKERKMQYEYYGIEIRYPTEELNTTLLFPKDFSPLNLTHDVWIGGLRYRHSGEYTRIELNDFFESSIKEDGTTFGRLVVPYPIQGLTYAIRWVPSS